MKPAETLVSAHRRDGDDEAAALDRALASGAHYVELDVRRTAAGELVVRHGPLAGEGHHRLADALRAVRGRAKAHLDLKEPGHEAEVLALASDVLGADGSGEYLLTTRFARSIVRAKELAPDVRCALSVGRPPWHPGFAADLRPVSRIRDCGADWVALNHRLAGLGVLERCARAGIPAMLWTVNAPRALRRVLADPRVAMVVTDHPHTALGLRHDGGSA
ncbi:glycerophosphodiester phosphodiesterase [Actinocorallia populi]|uniref:glycerophosphodiester phosphodiesterase n=1 Tax=Actinocorallia populi TaxID=2079200 RepID=UPI001E38C42C|nr:glycerophosphodiester phosphodiesterase [Actinocorallia populi]